MTLTHKTHSPKQADIQRKWYLVDVKGKTLGRIATKIADILRGKGKTIFSNHVDCGDYVIIVNAAEVKLSGNKEQQKTYYSHSRYSGGLKAVTVEKLRENRPEEIIKRAVAGMIPATKIKKSILKKLKVFAGPEHNLEAQQPQNLEL